MLVDASFEVFGGSGAAGDVDAGEALLRGSDLPFSTSIFVIRISYIGGDDL